MSFWEYMFKWWTGGVWSNIIASVLWAFPAWGFVLWRQTRHHKHVRQSLSELHQKHDALHVKHDDIIKALSKGKKHG